ncbi:MAG: PIN domain-containing protein [Planctomycetes bacterium]|nr:PIN domain-containing protein [Planctomycetota bacterium]
MLAEKLKGKRRVFLDTNAVIYYVEENSTYLPLLDPLFKMVADGQFIALSSYVTLLEVLVGPLKGGRPDIAQAYRDLLLNAEGFEFFPLDREVAEEAARLRAAQNFRTPDAIQLATARRHGADAFITNDKGFKRFVDMEVLVLNDCLKPGTP